MNMKKLFGWLTAVGIGFSVGTANATVIAYWKFEGTGSTFLSDSSGNGHHLTNFNSVPGSNHVSSTAASLNSSTQSAFFSDSGGKNLRTTATLNLSSYSALTVEFYMQGHFLGFSGIAFEHSANFNLTPGGLVTYMDSSNRIDAGWRNPGISLDRTTIPASGPPDGKWSDWHHVAVIFDKAASGNKIAMYVDGGFVGSDILNAATSGAAFINDTWFIGGRGLGAGLGFAGFIDEMRISSGVLTPDQFLMNAVPEPSTVVLLLTGAGILWYARKKR